MKTTAGRSCWWHSCWLVLTAPAAAWASIDIKTLPPDLRWLGGGDAAVRTEGLSRVSPDWAGDHTAVLDGDQGRVVLSWAINGDTVDFKVRAQPAVKGTVSRKLRGILLYIIRKPLL